MATCPDMRARLSVRLAAIELHLLEDPQFLADFLGVYR